MRSCLAFASLASTLIATVAAAPVSGGVAGNILAKRQYIDYGPFINNCSATPEHCPVNGPAGTLNSPAAGDVLTTRYDNSGYVDVSYTPVQGAAGNGSVATTSVIFTLRQYYYGAGTYSDDPILLGELAVPDDFSEIKARLSLPARFYDFNQDPQDDRKLAGTGQSGDIGKYAFQVVEQQRWTFDPNQKPQTIEFYSAAPIISINYVA